MVIYKSVPNIIITKMYACKQVGKQLRCGRMFVKDFGDIPVLRYNEQTKKFEEVDNCRGFGYASRNAKRYRNKKVRG